MRSVTFTEFRKNASELISCVEKGESLLVLRHGRPVAAISPPTGPHGDTPSWKKPGLRLAAKGVSLAEAILQERRREDAS